MNQPAPLVSLCVPTYRRAAFIGETLSSALQQTITDFEIIVVDDASPDATAAVVAGFSDPRIRYYRNEKNLGVPANIEHVVSLARGEFWMLLEDHDVLDPTYLEETLGVMLRHPTVGFVVSGLITIDQEGHPTRRFVEPWPEYLSGRWLLRRMLTRTHCPFSVSALVRRKLTEGMEPLFDAKYWWYADQNLWMRLAAKSDFGYVARPLLRFRDREGDHDLTDRFWESTLCLHQIHADNWQLLHPEPGWKAFRDAALYEVDKWRTVAGMRAGRMLRGEEWTAVDSASAERYLAAPGRWLLAAMSLVPRPLVARARQRYLAWEAGHRQVKTEPAHDREAAEPL